MRRTFRQMSQGADVSQTREQQRFTISEVAADGMVPQRVMRPVIAHANGQPDSQCR